MYFGYSVIIFPREKVLAFHMNKLESPLPRDAKFDWNWPIASGEDENMKSLSTDKQTQRDGQTKQEAHGQIAHLKNQFKSIK